MIGTVILNAWSRDYGKIENVNEATFELSHSVWETEMLPSPKRNILLSVKMEIKNWGLILANDSELCRYFHMHSG